MKVVNTIEVILNDKILTLPSWARFINYDEGYIMASKDGEHYRGVLDMKIKSIPYQMDRSYEICIDQHDRYIAVEMPIVGVYMNGPETQNENRG